MSASVLEGRRSSLPGSYPLDTVTSSAMENYHSQMSDHIPPVSSATACCCAFLAVEAYPDLGAVGDRPGLLEHALRISSSSYATELETYFELLRRHLVVHARYLDARRARDWHVSRRRAEGRLPAGALERVVHPLLLRRARRRSLYVSTMSVVDDKEEMRGIEVARKAHSQRTAHPSRATCVAPTGQPRHPPHRARHRC